MDDEDFNGIVTSLKEVKTGTKFRNGQNQRYTKQLFWDAQRNLVAEDRLIPPLYTLHTDRPGLINFQRVYVELADPTGYKLSQLYLENYNHWRMLMKSPWFREAKLIWDEELNAKLEAEGLTTIRALADGGEEIPVASQLSAAKFLASRSKTPAKRGRPSKEEVDAELKREVSSSQVLAEDAARMRLVN